MIFVTGPLFAGKRDYIKRRLNLGEGDCSAAFPTACPVVYDVQELARDCPDLEGLAEELARKSAVICTETGCGVVPVDAAERAAREAAGRLSVLLAQRAEKVVRIWCGLPQILKGEAHAD